MIILQKMLVICILGLSISLGAMQIVGTGLKRHIETFNKNEDNGHDFILALHEAIKIFKALEASEQENEKFKKEKNEDRQFGRGCDRKAKL